jgi:hypothetical protein
MDPILASILAVISSLAFIAANIYLLFVGFSVFPHG